MKNSVETVAAILGTNARPQLKEAAQKWLDATGALLDELNESVATIDETIGFFGSDKAKEFFGAEKAAEMLAHCEALKASGEKYCDCPGCAAGVAVLQLFGKA